MALKNKASDKQVEYIKLLCDERFARPPSEEKLGRMSKREADQYIRNLLGHSTYAAKRPA